MSAHIRSKKSLRIVSQFKKTFLVFIRHCYGLNEFPHNSFADALTQDVTVFGDEACGD